MDDATKALRRPGRRRRLFIWNRLPVGVVAILAALALWATGLVTTERGGRGLRRPGGHLHRDPVRGQRGHRLHRGDHLGRALADRPGRHRARARVLVAVCLLSALLTSLITLNGAVAALLPLVVAARPADRTPPSQLLMPVAFAGSAGGLLMLMSSPVNVIVSEAADDAGAGPFAFFSFALVGIPLLVGTVAICVLLGPRLLPRGSRAHPPDLGARETLEAVRPADGFYRLRVRSGRLIGGPTGRGPASRRAGAGRVRRTTPVLDQSTTTTSSWSPGPARGHPVRPRPRLAVA